MRVLIIGDEHVMRFLLEYTLRASTDWSIDVASDCTEALAKRTSATPDLIVIRMHLTEVKCAGAMSTLRTNEVTRGIPVVVVTDASEVEFHESLIEKGAAGCLTEPFDPSSLPAQLASIAGRPVAAEALPP